MEKLKLALINNLYPPYIVGGNEMLAHDVVSELRMRGHEVHVLTGQGKMFHPRHNLHMVLNLDLDKKEESFLGGKKPTVLDLFQRHLFNYRSLKSVKQALREIGPDLVIGWNLYMASMAPLMASRQLGLPTVIHVCDKWLLFSLRDLQPLLRLNIGWQKAVLWIIRQTLQRILSRSTDLRHIVAISDFMKRKYVEAGFPESCIGVIHLGVPTQVLAYTERVIRDDVPVRLLYVGQLWEGKGPQVALNAVSYLVHQRGITNFTLDVCGAGAVSFISRLKGIAAQENLQDIVAFRGFVERPTAKEMYSKSDVLVFPSIWDEPFAAVPVEAMSCGMAIVATSAGGTPEAIENERTGLLVRPDDHLALAAALERLIKNAKLRGRLGAEAARVARQRFDFSQYVDALEAYYRQVVEQTRPGGKP